MSIATVSLSGDLAEKLHAIAGAGFKGVEIFENDLLSFSGTPADVRKLVGDLGLEIVAFQPFRDFEGMPADKRERVFARAERKFDLMQELGCDLLLVCSNVSPESLGGIDRAAADLGELGERAKKRGLRIGFEALAWGRHINDYRDAWEAVCRADHAAVGLVLDSFHALARKTDLKAKTDLLAERIEALKAHNILYDREGAAEFLQAYTGTFEDRFFFEIVEPRDYKGFGAANAPIRLAAQARLARDLAVP
jgi:4-hydroxyphenylpyruvate dioxygenase